MSIQPVANFVPLNRAWYVASVTDFIAGDPDSIVGQLVINSSFAVTPGQTQAWVRQIALLKDTLRGLEGEVLFEFSIPRMGRRIDVVLLTSSAVFVIEFKVGASSFERGAIDQVWDYALDLKYFHEASHSAPIFPILVATEFETTGEVSFARTETRCTTRSRLARPGYAACSKTVCGRPWR